MTTTLRPSGPLNLDTVTRHLSALDDLAGADLVTVELSDVTEADSSAVALLLAWCRSARTRQLDIRYTGVPDGLRSLIAVYGLTGLLPLAE